ncbi:MAG: Gfo/Idh/MocA family oxidoreductase, partial [Elusimicrobiota bacterium]
YPLKENLKNGAIGEIIQVSAYYVYGLVTTGTHLVDTLRFLLKDISGDIRWVSAFPNTLNHFHPPDDPCLDGWVGFENGLKASVQSLNIQDYDIFDFYFYGRRGKVVFKNIGRDIDIYKVTDSPEHQGFAELSQKPSQQLGGEPRDQFGFLAAHVVRCLEGKETSLSTGEDSLKALEILLAMQESARHQGKVVTL